jgi:hypothetical protein
MAKRRQEERPPLELPLARLFLDDLEEMGRIFMETRIKWEDRQPQEGEGAPRITYRVDEWECDTIQDLKDLGRMKDSFEIRLEEFAGPMIYTYIVGRRFVCGSAGLPPEGEWALYARVLGLVGKRKILWYPWRRSELAFQTSFEYSGFFASFKRHGSQIAIAVASAIATLAATGVVRTIWQYFHHGK